MTIDLDPGPELRALAEQTAAFVSDVAIPAEPRDVSQHGLDGDLRAELQHAAKAAGLFAPHVSAELGGLGLDVRGQAVIFEQAGYSILGPQASSASRSS